ncbi:DUF2927 domain-containing protein [Profundibacter sp.]|uniref:DUF2927 domain-containing protein n=1 Tax=Profundibacter sp. TaxID=3101071 RepID=UPI003D0B93F8
MAGIGKTAVALLTLGLTGLTGCVTPPPENTLPAPKTRPAPPRPEVKPRSQASLEMAAFYKQRQAYFLVNDLLRVDGGGPDTPFTQRNLVDNFIRIAMFGEYATKGGKLIARPTETRLNKWQGPIRIHVQFGETVPLEQRSKDRASIRKYTKRLSRLTGLTITLTNQSPNQKYPYQVPSFMAGQEDPPINSAAICSAIGRTSSTVIPGRRRSS